MVIVGRGVPRLNRPTIRSTTMSSVSVTVAHGVFGLVPGAIYVGVVG